MTESRMSVQHSRTPKESSANNRFAQISKYLNRITIGDSLLLLKEIPSNSIDLIYADPPYFLQLGSNPVKRPDNSVVEGVNENWDTFDGFRQYDKFTWAWLKECQRALKVTGTIWVSGSYHNAFRIGRIMQDMGFWTLNDVIWIKSNPMPNFAGVRLTNAHEHLIWAKKGKKSKGYTFNYQFLKRYNQGKQLRSDWYIKEEKPDVFTLPICSGRERLKDAQGKKLHPTQKPKALLERIILGCSKEGDIVLDPFAGTGTSCKVAEEHGRKYIGFEKEPKYVFGAN